VPDAEDALDRLAPRDETPARDWADVVRRAPRSARRPSNALRLALGVAVGALLLVTSALALSHDLRRSLTFGLWSDRPVRPVFAAARLLVEAPAGNGVVARVFEAPASAGGGTCWFTERVPAGTAPTPQNGRGGRSCTVGAYRAERDSPITWAIDIQPRTRNNRKSWQPPLLHGRIKNGVNAERVVLRWRTGEVQLPFKNGHFLYVSPALYRPPRRNFPYDIVAIAADGHVAAHVRIFRSALLVE
jgi:hypothetical protein